jgi:hypothetical protein
MLEALLQAVFHILHAAAGSLMVNSGWLAAVDWVMRGPCLQRCELSRALLLAVFGL